MKLTTSRTGLHKVRVGDRVVIRGNRCGDDVVTKVGRLLVHCGRDAFRIEDGQHVTDRAGFGCDAWDPDTLESVNRCRTKLDKIARRFRGWDPGKDITESQLDRILAILEEVQT